MVRRPLMRSCVCVVLLALVLGCGRSDTSERADEPGSPYTTDQPADEAMERTAECVNEAESYSVQYPADWHVNTEGVLGSCSLFDPDPIEVPRDSEIPLEIAVIIDVESIPFTAATGDVLGRRDLVRERTTVAGREAMRIEAESTGEGLYDRGIRSYQVFVDLGDRTMIAATYDVGSLDFERKRRLLDLMMETLELRNVH